MSTSTVAPSPNSPAAAAAAADVRDAIARIIAIYDRFEALDFEVFDRNMVQDLVGAISLIANTDIPAAMNYLLGPLVEVATTFLDAARLMEADETPGRPFRDACYRLRRVREDGPPMSGIEPVADLFDQLKGCDDIHGQIARMYGTYDSEEDRWFGPFFNAKGWPVAELIEREGREPGSVVPPGFDPRNARLTAQREAAAEKLRDLRPEIKRLAFALTGKPVVTEKGSVEQLLREGLFPDAIAGVKGVTEKSVRDEARRLGIIIRERDEILNAAGAAIIAGDARRKSGAYLDALGGGSSADLIAESGAGPILDLDPVAESESTAAPASAATVTDADWSAALADEPESSVPPAELVAINREELAAFLKVALAAKPELKATEAMAQLQAAGKKSSAVTIGRVLTEIRSAG